MPTADSFIPQRVSPVNNDGLPSGYDAWRTYPGPAYDEPSFEEVARADALAALANVKQELWAAINAVLAKHSGLLPDVACRSFREGFGDLITDLTYAEENAACDGDYDRWFVDNVQKVDTKSAALPQHLSRHLGEIE